MGGRLFVGRREGSVLGGAHGRDTFLILNVFLLNTYVQAPMASVPSVINRVTTSFRITAADLKVLAAVPLVYFNLITIMMPVVKRGLNGRLAVTVTLLVLFTNS